ncbi:unnamed protein product [Sphagnum jensenii]|uniref:Uncharacterized protein n=1 Tax=Sphagnum jensenii TaxID=128206 RepID=A0ABP0W1J6_9BRYO
MVNCYAGRRPLGFVAMGVHNKLLSSTVGRIPPDPTGICVADVHCHQAVGHVSTVSSNLLGNQERFAHEIDPVGWCYSDPASTSIGKCSKSRREKSLKSLGSSAASAPLDPHKISQDVMEINLWGSAQ